MILLLSITTLKADDGASGTIEQVSADYEARLKTAAAELVATRDSIMQERIPAVTGIRQLEDQAIKLNSKIVLLETQKADLQNQQSDLASQLDSLSKNLNYSVLLAQEIASTLEASMLPGEATEFGDILVNLKHGLDVSDNHIRYSSSRKAFDLILARLKRQLGGNISEGLSVINGSKEVCEGQFLHLGPVTYFRDNVSGTAGMAFQRKGSLMPITYPMKKWDSETIENVFVGKAGYFLADATGGKALHLMEARGSSVDHVKKGGVVGYVIIALGILAILTALLKLWDLRSLSVDKPKKIKRHIDQLNHRDEPGSTQQFSYLKQSCRELFSIAIKHRDKPKELLEEMMFAHILLQRNLHERRLPMLRVIASAAPLLGLLGTVVGMIKTFTLITVVGTGNAAKLSSGISEALVTTELGLVVAIPTLIIYGYLSHQTEKRLSLLEQYSVELVNTLQWVHGKPTSKEGQLT